MANLSNSFGIHNSHAGVDVAKPDPTGGDIGFFFLVDTTIANIYSLHLAHLQRQRIPRCSMTRLQFKLQLMRLCYEQRV
jgi:hypothetical protein